MNPWPIAPLGPKDLDFAIVNYDFTGLAADNLGPLPPLETAMDTILSDFAASIADQGVLIASMDGLFDDFANVLSELANDNFEQVAAAFDGIQAAGDGLLNDYVALVAPSSGSGGSGGVAIPIKTATGPLLHCDAAIAFSGSAPTIFPEHITVQFTNGANVPVKLLSLTLVQPAGGPFSATTDCTDAPLQPGESCNVTATLDRPSPAGTSAQVQAVTDFTTTPQTLCLSVGETGGGGGGGGGVCDPVTKICPIGSVAFGKGGTI